MTRAAIASIQEAWGRPLKPFLEGCGEILKQFDAGISAADGWVKENEAREKGRKRAAIQAYFDGKNFDRETADAPDQGEPGRPVPPQTLRHKPGNQSKTCPDKPLNRGAAAPGRAAETAAERPEHRQERDAAEEPDTGAGFGPGTRKGRILRNRHGFP
jgi:hypothetical protein